MLNFSFRNFSNLNKFLIEFGFDEWKTLTASFFLPIIGIRAWFLARWAFVSFFDANSKIQSFSIIVFFASSTSFICYKTFHLDSYISNLNTYTCSIYLIYFGAMANFLYPYENTLQMAILLTRIKIFNSFVKKHFSASPRVFSITFFLALTFPLLLPLK